MKSLYLIVFLFIGSLTFSQAPAATISIASPTLCSNVLGLFSSITTNTPTAYTWTVSPVNGANFVQGNATPTIAINFRNAGIYSVSLTVSNASGTVTAVKTVTVLQAPLAAFSASLTNSGFPTSLNLTNFSTNANTYLWSYSETALTDNSTDVIHTYTASGSFSVSLVSYNSNGCSDTSRYHFFINDSSGVTLPNVFTPNSDGINDIFKPIAKGMSNIKVDIYTRWGTFVYGWDLPNGFWDGHTTSGEPCISGTYFYVVEATGFDGKSYKLKSFLTLLRD